MVRKGTRIYFVLFSVILFLVSEVPSCGGDGGGRLHEGVMRARTERSLSLNEVSAQLSRIKAPEGVDADVFAQVKDELARQSPLGRSLALHPDLAGGKSSDQRFVSKPPTGKANRISDLALQNDGDGTFEITWTYKNLGDYAQDGIVDVADMATLAEHF